MQRYIGRRLLISIPVFLGITLLVFVFINLAPGDPILAMMDPMMPGTVDVDALRESLGLNKPLLVRYGLWMKEIFRGNLGYSYRTYTSIADMLVRKVPATLLLMGTGLFISSVLGILIGIASALFPYSRWDYGLSVVAFIGVSVPEFFLGLALIFVLAGRLHILPSFGMRTAGMPPSLLDTARHLIMPATVLALATTGYLARQTRASLLEVLHAPYISAARAKGLKERRVIWTHAFRSAIIPVITVIGLRLPWLLGGSIVVETVFSWPGIGSFLITSITGRDYPAVMAISLITAASVLLGNLITDIVYAFADPRIRYE